MITLTPMKGLPGSGKSTIAATLVDSSTVRVNRDLLREMLHFNKLGINNELLVRDMELMIAREAFLRGKNVIVDNTNLDGTSQWERLAEDFGAQIIIRNVDTDWKTSIERDRKRGEQGGRSMGRFFITFMAVLRSLNPNNI